MCEYTEHIQINLLKFTLINIQIEKFTLQQEENNIQKRGKTSSPYQILKQQTKSDHAKDAGVTGFMSINIRSRCNVMLTYFVLLHFSYFYLLF